MRFRFIIECEADREDSGLFETRDSIEAAIIEAIESADPGSVTGDNGTAYAVDGWSVSAEPVGKR